MDTVINHMSKHDTFGTGTGGSSFDGGQEDYPGVPYSHLDFHQPFCIIHDYGNPVEVILVCQCTVHCALCTVHCLLCTVHLFLALAQEDDVREIFTRLLPKLIDLPINLLTR